MPDKPTEDRLAQSMQAASGQPLSVPFAELPAGAYEKVPGSLPQQAPSSVLGDLAELLQPESVAPAAKQAIFVKDEFDFEPVLNMAFLGAGQGGGRIADAFWRLGYRRVSVFNLTDSDFDGLNENITRYSLEVGGAAKDSAFAAAQLHGHEEDLWDLVARSWGVDVDYGLICVGLGGGSGSGTAPQLVEIARKYLESQGRPPRVGAIVSLPTVSEGQQVCLNALKTFRRLMELKVSPLIIIDNTRVHEAYRPGITKLFPLANALISKTLHVFLRLCEKKGATHQFDRSELAQILDGGIVAMGGVTIKSEDIKSPADVSSAIRDKIANSLLAEVDLKTATKGACLFVGSDETLAQLSMDYFNAGFEYMNRMLKHGGVLHRGVFADSAAGLSIFAIVSGLEPPAKRLQELAKQAGMDVGHARMRLAEFLGVDDAK
jgi:cell division GTPase FtsZ